MYLRIVSLLLLALPALAFTQTPEDGKNHLDKQLEVVSKRLEDVNRRLYVVSQDKAKPFPKGRGRVAPSKEISAARHLLSDARHGKKLAALPKATEATFDWRAAGVVGAMRDQGQCGNCYQWSGIGVAESAQILGGTAKPSTNFTLSVQNYMDCHPELGGCNGGDEWEVAQLILAKGIADVTAYPGDGQSQRQCKNVPGTYRIVSMGYCDVGAGANSVASTQSMKDCIKKYGPISVAVAAGSWGDPGGSVMVGPDDGIDHAVQIVGWKTGTNGKTVWIVRNQWSTQWGDGGYCYIQEGSYGIGTEAFWVSAGTPVPPQPQPPQPTGPVTITLTPQQVAAVLAASGTTPPTASTIVITPELATAFQTIADAFSKASKK